jgi:hypothetical protein
MKFNPVIGILLIFLISCTHPEEKIGAYKVDLKSWPKEADTLDNLVSKIRVIALETRPECLIGTIKGLYQNDQGFYLLTDKIQIMHFDLTGRFIWKIDKKGKGPGEYQYIFDFALDDKGLILLDSSGKKLLFYDLNGQFIKEITNVPAGIGITCSGMEYLAILHGRAASLPLQKRELSIIRLDGTAVSTFFPFDKNEGMSLFSSFTRTSTGKVLFHPHFEPVIYEISGASIDTLIRFDFQQAPVHSFREMGEAAEFIGIRRIVDTDKTFAAIFQSKSESSLWLLNHETGNSKLLSSSGLFYGFPLSTPVWSNGKEFIDSRDALDIIEILGKTDHGNLESLKRNIDGFNSLEQLNQDDNPVLIFYKFVKF